MITCFSGSYHDWLRCWSQFTAEIDSADTCIADVTKFSYLKELVEPKIQSSIDGLLRTCESVLADRYENNSKIVNSYVEEIINLLTIAGAQPARIHPFYEKLMKCMHWSSLAMWMVMWDWLWTPGIRRDLARTEPEWKEWNCTQLVVALRAWTERNPETKPQEKPPAPQYKRRDRPSRVFQTHQTEHKARVLVYCEATNNKSSALQHGDNHYTQKEISDRKEIML